MQGIVISLISKISKIEYAHTSATSTTAPLGWRQGAVPNLLQTLRKLRLSSELSMNDTIASYWYGRDRTDRMAV